MSALEKPARLYAVSTGHDFLNPRVKVRLITAEQLTRRLRKFHVAEMTRTEYRALSVREKAVVKKQSGFFIGGDGDGLKTRESWKFSSMATLDLDDLTPERAKESVEAIKDLDARAVIYSTASHSPDMPRLRAVIFLAEDVARNDYPHLIERLAARLPPGAVSSESLKPTQIMYLPQRCSDGEEFFLKLPGEPLVAEPFLAETGAKPRAERSDKVTPAWDKPGIVGAVARRYEGDLDAAIEELGNENIPYERASAGPTCAIGEARYTRIRASGADGAIWYPNDGHLFSHHGKSDPGAEKNQTIFDIVRLTHFKNLDKDVTPDTPFGALPSQKAAAAWFIERFPEMARSPEDEFDNLDIMDGLLPADSPKKVETAVQQEPHKGRKPLIFQKISSDILTRELPEQPFALYPLFPCGTTTALVAMGGFGKTHLAIKMAVHKALGFEFGGHPCTPGRVVIVTGEDRFAEFERRVQKVIRHLVDEGVSIDWDLLRANLDIVDRVGCGAENLMVRARGAGVVHSDLPVFLAQQIGRAEIIILDTKSRFAGGDENDNGAGSAFISACELLATLTGAAVCVLAHTGKIAGREGIVDQYSIRGASSIADDARSVIVLASPTEEQKKRYAFDPKKLEDLEVFRMVHVKHNLSKKADDVFLQRLDNGAIIPFTPQQRRVMTEEDRTWQLLDHIGTKEITRNQLKEKFKGIFGSWFTRDEALKVFDETRSKGLLVYLRTRNRAEFYKVSDLGWKRLRDRTDTAEAEFDKEPASESAASLSVRKSVPMEARSAPAEVKPAELKIAAEVLNADKSEPDCRDAIEVPQSEPTIESAPVKSNRAHGSDWVEGTRVEIGGGSRSSFVRNILRGQKLEFSETSDKSFSVNGGFTAEKLKTITEQCERVGVPLRLIAPREAT